MSLACFDMSIQATQHGIERRRNDIAVNANAKASCTLFDTRFNITRSASICTGANRVLVIIHDPNSDAQAIHKRRNCPIARAFEYAAYTVHCKLGFDRKVPTFRRTGIAGDAVPNELPGFGLCQIFCIKNRVDGFSRDLATGFIRDALNRATEFNL